MPYISVKDYTQPDVSPITGIFNMPQTDPNVTGYVGWVDDSDERITAFITAIQTASQKSS